MLFKKKKEENNQILYNIEGNAYLNTTTGEFLLPFTTDQKTYIMHCLNTAYDVYTGKEYRHSHNFRPIADPEIPLGVMRNIMIALYENERGKTFLTEREYRIRDIDIWKVAKLFSTYPETEWEKIPAFIECLWFGVKIWEEIPDFTKFNTDVFVMVFWAASCGVNICDEVYPGMDMESFERKIKAIYKNKEEKAARKKMAVSTYEMRYIKTAKKH